MEAFSLYSWVTYVTTWNLQFKVNKQVRGSTKVAFFFLSFKSWIHQSSQKLLQNISMYKIINLTRNWSMLRTVSKVLIRSCILSAVLPAGCCSPSCASLIYCNFPSGYLCLTSVLSRLCQCDRHRLYLLPVSIQCRRRWLTGMGSAAHTHRVKQQRLMQTLEARQ